MYLANQMFRYIDLYPQAGQIGDDEQRHTLIRADFRAWVGLALDYDACNRCT